jgi:thioredoxin reductase (NADPH)
MDKIYDLIIIGAGPAGLSAAIYASRAMLDYLVLERSFPGGQIINTYEVENYPGVKSTSGFELGSMMLEHAQSLGVTIQTETVTELDLTQPVKKVMTSENAYQTRTLILATGATPGTLGISGEKELLGRGISGCATCDGGLFKGKVTAVVGGGDVAVEDAIYLSRMCQKVYLIHRRDSLRAVKVMQEKLFSLPNVEIVWDSLVTEVKGRESVESITIKNKKTGKQEDLDVNGLFIAVGFKPNAQLVEGKVDTTPEGWIVTNEQCETSVEGVFAAGDVRNKSLRQVVTSVADGAIAEFTCEKRI